jgi:hypothetical protein
MNQQMIAKINEVIEIANQHFANECKNQNFHDFMYVHLEAEIGRKYVRLVKCDKEGVQRSAWCFVGEDGRLWKPAGYKTPAKNFSRGSLDDLKNESFIKANFWGV